MEKNYLFDKLRLQRQIEFFIEIDKLKQVFRQTFLMDKSRQENSAEHSWHIALMAIILSEYVENSQIDILRVIKMLLIHDVVEIDAGDICCYNNVARENLYEQEVQAAKRIFNLLPVDQAQQMKSLWEEFEACKTLNSRFANVLDRLQPLLSNYYTDGKAWVIHSIKRDQLIARNFCTKEDAPKLWHYVLELVEDSVRKGILKE